MRIMYRRLLFLWDIHAISNLNATTIFNVTLGGAYKTVSHMVMKRETETFFEKWRFNTLRTGDAYLRF